MQTPPYRCPHSLPGLIDKKSGHTAVASRRRARLEFDQVCAFFQSEKAWGLIFPTYCLKVSCRPDIAPPAYAGGSDSRPRAGRNEFDGNRQTCYWPEAKRSSRVLQCTLSTPRQPTIKPMLTWHEGCSHLRRRLVSAVRGQSGANPVGITHHQAPICPFLPLNPNRSFRRQPLTGDQL